MLVKEALLGRGIKTIGAKTTKYFANVRAMRGMILRVNENVVQIDDDRDIQHISEDVVHEPLEGCWRVRKTEGHNEPFKRAIASAKGSLPFVALSDTNEVISVL